MSGRAATALGRALRRLARDDGSISIEAVIMLPTLILFYVTSFTFFDAYRTQTVLTKSGYVVGDYLSRQDGMVRPADIAGLRDVFNYLTFTSGQGEIRVSEIVREADPAPNVRRHVVRWSHSTRPTKAGEPPDELSTADLQGMLDRIPSMAVNERLTLVETFTAYEPPFFVGLPAYTMEMLVVTRQRSGQMCFVSAGATACS